MTTLDFRARSRSIWSRDHAEWAVRVTRACTLILKDLIGFLINFRKAEGVMSVRPLNVCTVLGQVAPEGVGKTRIAIKAENC